MKIKKHQLSYKKIIIVCLIGVSLVILGIIFFYHFLPTKEALLPIMSNTDTCNDPSCMDTAFFLVQQKKLEERLKKEEPAIIYKEILTKYAQFLPDNKHRIAHIFGKLLYKEKGSSGVIVCDGSFAFGCYHGFFNEAIGKEGVWTVKEIDQRCVKQFGEYSLGCQHGIGHGLAEYFGPKNIDQALEVCEGLTWKHRLMGCPGGVFMEYMMPTLGDDIPGSVYVKPIDETNPYSPCNKISEKYRPECYYNLGLYFVHTPKENYQKGLSLCSKITDNFYKKNCFMGFGNGAISLNINDAKIAIKICSNAPGLENQISCRSGAGWILYSSSDTRGSEAKVCANLSDTDSKKCINDSNLLKTALAT